MKITRLSATSVAAIQVADHVEIVPILDGEGIPAYALYAWHGGRLCACHNGQGWMQLYESLSGADRAIARARAGLGPVPITVRAPLTRAA